MHTRRATPADPVFGPTTAARATRRSPAIGIAACALALLPPAAAGQEPASLDTLPLFHVAPLEVTVLRATVDPATAPYAVSALGREELVEGKTGAFLEEALETVPGVQVQNRFNLAMGERLSVRGFGVRAQFGVRGVRVLVDGIPATLPDGQTAMETVHLGSVGHVEILRGPGSAFYGNAAGGVLSFHTRPPPPSGFRQEARLVGGSDGLYTVDATASGTSDGGTGWLVSAGALGWGGFRGVPDAEETYGEADRRSAVARLVRPLGSGTLRMTANVVDQDGENPGSLPLDLLDTRQAWGFNVRAGTGESTTQGQVGVSWDGPASDDLDADLAAWYIGRDNEGFIPPAAIALQRNAFGARAALRGEAGRATWGVGGEAEVQRDDRQNWENEGGTRGALTLDQFETVRALSAFAQARLPLAESLSLSAALRYDRFRFRAEDDFTGAGDPDDSGSRVMDAFNPSAGVVWTPAPEATLFANVATSLETPTTTELTNRPGGAGGFNPDLEPARGTTVEGGIRGLASERLRWELVLFRTRVEDELVPFEVPESPGRSFFRNAGSSTHEGVEALVEARLAPSLSGRVAWSHTDARFDEYEADGEVFDGNRLPGLAPHRVEGRLRLDRPAWFGEVSAEWVDEIPVNDANSATAPSHTLVGLRAGLEPVTVGGLEVAPFAGVANLLDELYVTSVVVNAFGGRYFEPGPGRTFHVGVSAAWAP